MRNINCIIAAAGVVLLSTAAHAACNGDQLAKLLPSDGGAGDQFGRSVAISGITAIVGSPTDGDNGDGSGSAYLFDTTTGMQTFKLLPSDGAGLEQFGVSVAISGTTAIVAANFDDDNGLSSGSAYLFDTTTGMQTFKLLPMDGAASDEFGFSVAISGTTAIVGAFRNDDNGDDTGSAYLFDTTTGMQTFKLLPTDAAAGDFFGISVAISGTTAIVGSRGDSVNGDASGSAYLFDTTTGMQLAKLLPTDGAVGQSFGHSVAISGTTAIVGALFDNDNGGSSGSAYLFDTTTGMQMSKLLPSDGAPGDLFGISVAISGTTAIVGAWLHDDNGGDSGSAYFFDTATGTQLAKLLPIDGAPGDHFGISVAISGTTAIVGANFDGDNGNASGSAYLFDTVPRSQPGWNHVSAEITLTKNEPAYWSVATGQPKGLPPFTVLDPAGPPTGVPGRLDPECSGDWILRGYVVGWAVNANNEEIRWNHLKGDAVTINYEQNSAWEYNAWSFPVVNGTAHGAQSGTPGVLNLDGSEYAPGFAMLVLDFYAPGNTPFPDTMIDTDLTLLPVSVDLRQEDDGLVTTKAKIDIWNENEIKFNGTERCITCWDQTLLRDYTELGVPNSFLYGNLQTDKGKARIDGIRSDNCDVDYEFDPDIPFGDDPRDVVSQDASLLGVSSKHISFGSDRVVAAAGTNLIGMGDEGAVIKYDPLGGTPESAGAANAIRRALLRRGGEREPVGATEGAASTVDRVSGSEKGSLIIWSNVEIRWDSDGNLIQDTFLDVSNDFGEDVRFQMYFINGDPPVVASP